MAILDDFIIDYANRMIFHLDTESTVYSSRELYSANMDLFDELGQMDDTVPMSAQTPTEFTLINSWFMHYNCFKFLSGGAIQTNGWDCSAVAQSGIRIFDLESAGYVNFVNTDTGLIISGTTNSETGVVLAFDNDLRRVWVRIPNTGCLFDDIEDVAVMGGAGSGTLSEVSRSGENLWPNIYTLGTITGETNLYISQDGEIVDPWWSAEHIDVLINTKEAGTEIDAGVITIFDRKFLALYDNYQIDLTNGGRNAVPLATSNDVNNTGVEATVSGYTSISFTFDSTAQNLNNGNGLRPYDVIIDFDGSGVYGGYEYTKFVTRSGSAYILSGLTGDRYRYLKGGDLGETKQAPFGTFAGGKFFFARGVWPTNYNANDSQNFQLIDSSGVSQIPPNSVTIELTDMVSGFRASIYRLVSTGGPIKKNEYQGDTLNVSSAAFVSIQETISGDAPPAGWVIIDGDDYKYSSWESDTTGRFFLDGVTLSTTYSNGDAVYTPIIYTGCVSTTLQNTLIYSADFPILMRARLKGYQPWEVETTVTNAGRSLPVTKITDSIVT